MLGFFTGFLRGDNLNRLERFKQSGDIRELAEVGYNNVLLEMSAELELRQRIDNALIEERAAEREARELEAQLNQDDDEVSDGRRVLSEEDEAHLEMLKRRKAAASNAVKVADFDLDSEAGVKSFLDSF